MVDSDEFLLIIPPFVKVEVGGDGDEEDEIMVEPLSPHYNPDPSEGDAGNDNEFYEEEGSDRGDSGSDWEKETKPPVRTPKSKKAKTLKKSSSVPSSRKKSRKTPLEKRDEEGRASVKEEVTSADEEAEETPQIIPKTTWRKKRASDMTPEELEAKRIKWRDESRKKRERQRQSLSKQQQVRPKTEPADGLDESEDEGEASILMMAPRRRKKRVSEMTPEELEAQRVQWREEAQRKQERKGLSPGQVQSGADNAGKPSEKITVNGVHRRKRVDEMTPEEHAALKVKWREEARLKREKRRQSQGLEPILERERSAPRERRDCAEFRAKEAEARRQQRARMTPQELEERRRKDRERRREKRRLCGYTEADAQARRRYLQRKKETMTPEKRAEESQKAAMRKIMRLVSMTEEQLAERKQRIYMQNVARFARMTREEREECRQRHKEKQREVAAQRTPEEVEKTKEKNRARYRNMTPEQKEKFMANRERYKKKMLEKLMQDPERMNNIRAKVKATNERKGRRREPGEGPNPKRKSRQRLPIEVARQRKRLCDKKRRLKRKLMVQDLLDSGMPMEEIMQKLETSEQRSRRLMKARVAAAKRKLRKQLSEMGAPPAQIQTKLAELEQTYEPPKHKVYKPRPSKFKRVDRSLLDELLEMKPNPVIPTQTEPSPPPSPVNNDEGYDGCGHDDDYSCNASPPPPERESQEVKVSSYHPQSTASHPYHHHPHRQNNWEAASTSTSTCQPIPPVVFWRNNQNPPQPPPPPREYQGNWEEAGSSSDSDGDGRRNHQTPSKRTGAGRKDYGPRGGFRVTLESGTKKLATCDECGHVYAAKYMYEHKHHFHNKNFVDGKCILCGVGFPTGKLFYRHYLKDHEKVTTSRKRCSGSKVRHKANSMTPEQLETWKQTLVVCDLCGNSYARKQISTHKKVQHNPNYVGGKCTICNAAIENARSYFTHFRTEHRKEEDEALKSKQKLVCDICGKGFPENHLLARHIHYTHGEGAKEENFSKCPICEKKFKYKQAMEQHVEKYHPSEAASVIRHHECRHCHEKFKYQTELGEHKSTQHPELYFPCSHCKSLRTSKQNLYFHFFVCKKTPKGFVKELGDKNIVSLEKTPLKCEVCEKDVTVNSLKRHYREVHGVEEDLYPCGECPKMFKIREYWVNHMDEVHGFPFDDELKEKVRKMHVLDKSIVKIKEGERPGRRKKRGKGKPRSRRKTVRFEKFVKVSSEEDEEAELTDREDTMGEDYEDVESEAVKRMSRVGTRSCPRMKREPLNVEEERRRLVISVVRMSEEEIRKAARKKEASTILDPTPLSVGDSLMF